MIKFQRKHRHSYLTRLIISVIILSFTSSLVIPPQKAYAQSALNLPAPGTMILVSPGFTPAIIRGIQIFPENPLKFDFIIDRGQSELHGEEFKKESTKLIKYFLASLTVPEDDLWVNLSPYEKDRIIPEEFGVTEMGRDLLAQDYLLKQLTASLMYPASDLGFEFWMKVREKARELFSTTDIPMNTFNKIWIVPDKAVVYEHAGAAFVVDSHLKVMLEEDYLALMENISSPQYGTDQLQTNDIKRINDVSSDVIRELLLPEIEKEVNEGKNFANLRQVYQSMILAAWYKKTLKQGLLAQIYVDQNKTMGIDVEDKNVKEKIYQQYLEAFKKGVYNFIQEDYDPVTQEVIPRKYFSGGFTTKKRDAVTGKVQTLVESVETFDNAMLAYVSPKTRLAYEDMTKGLQKAQKAGNLERHTVALTESEDDPLSQTRKTQDEEVATTGRQEVDSSSKDSRGDEEDHAMLSNVSQQLELLNEKEREKLILNLKRLHQETLDTIMELTDSTDDPEFFTITIREQRRVIQIFLEKYASYRRKYWSREESFEAAWEEAKFVYLDMVENVAQKIQYTDINEIIEKIANHPLVTKNEANELRQPDSPTPLDIRIIHIIVRIDHEIGRLLKERKDLPESHTDEINRQLNAVGKQAPSGHIKR